MAWTSPRTWVAAETVTAAMLNTHLRDNLVDVAARLDAVEGQAATQFGANVTEASNSGTSETTLQTITLPGGALAANGDVARVVAAGTFAANANTKTVRLKIGGTTVATITGSTGWFFDLFVARLGSTSLLVWGGSATPVGAHFTGIYAVSVTATLSGDVTISLTGQSDTASGDVTAKVLTGWLVR